MKALFRVTPVAHRELDHDVRLASLVRFTHPPGSASPRDSALPLGMTEVVASDEVLGQRMTCVPRLVEARQGWTLYWTASDAGWAVRHADTTTFAIW